MFETDWTEGNGFAKDAVCVEETVRVEGADLSMMIQLLPDSVKILLKFFCIS